MKITLWCWSEKKLVEVEIETLTAWDPASAIRCDGCGNALYTDPAEVRLAQKWFYLPLKGRGQSCKRD